MKRRTSITAAAAIFGGIGIGLLAPSVPAVGATVVLSDSVQFLMTTSSTGALTTTGCRLTSNAEPNTPREVDIPCVAGMQGYPQGKGTVTVPSDPSETIDFQFTVSTSGAMTGPAVETEIAIPGTPPRTYPGFIRGISRQYAPGKYFVRLRVYEISTSP